MFKTKGICVLIETLDQNNNKKNRIANVGLS